MNKFKSIKYLVAGWISILALPGFSQTKSCCSKPTSNTETFAMLGEKPEFQSNHESPVPFTYETVNGKSITFKTDDGKTGSAFEIKAAKPTENYVFLIHEWWGLNDYIKQEAENLQKELGNVNVVALDLYDGKIATNPTDAGKLMGEVKQERAASIVKGAISYAGAKAKIYTIGWCFGGGWSLQASLLAGKQSAGCVIYYGQPEADVEKLKALNSDVLFIAATQDKWINPELVASFEKNMGTAGKKVTVKSFDADHAFANPSNPKHNKEFAASANSLVLAFFKERMKG